MKFSQKTQLTKTCFSFFKLEKKTNDKILENKNDAYKKSSYLNKMADIRQKQIKKQQIKS